MDPFRSDSPEVLTTEEWRVLVHDEPTAAAQMAFDERLAAEGVPTLRLFQWRAPALSFGFRQRPPEWIDPSRCAAQGVELVERPTGGGLAVHGTDLSCSVVIPRKPGGSLNRAMSGICDTFAQACRSCNVFVEWNVETRGTSRVEYCLTDVSPYALMVGSRPSTSLRTTLGDPPKIVGGESKGRKLGGFAIRAYAASWLIQGSLLIRPMPEAIRRIMPKSVQLDYDTRAMCLEEAAGGEIGIRHLQEALVSSWCLTP